MMVTILKELTPTYYGGNLVGNMADQKVLEALLRHHLPACSESLQSNEVPAQSALTLPSHHALRLPGEHGYDRYTVAPLAVCQRIADRDGASCVGHFLPRWTGGLRLKRRQPTTKLFQEDNIGIFIKVLKWSWSAIGPIDFSIG